MSEKLDILIKEYDTRTAEISDATQRYHRQTNFTYLYTSVIISITGLLSSSKEARDNLLSLQAAVGSLDIIYLLLLSLAAMIGFYLFSSTMDSLFMLTVNGARRAALERMINEELGENTMEWDNRIISHLLSKSFVGVGLWVKPNLLVAVWIFLFFIATNVLLGLLSFVLVAHLAIIYTAILSILAAFHVFQWYMLTCTGNKYIVHVVENNPYPGGRTPATIAMLNHMKRSFPVYATVLFGVLPIIFLSYASGSLYLSSSCQFPLLANTSVIIGDLFLMPLFNLRFYQMFRQAEGRGFSSRVTHVAVACASLIVSAVLQYKLHMLWISDMYTGFMDLQLGSLSPAGWWHFAYATVQMAVILTYASCWFIESRRNDAVYKTGSSGWNVLIMFLLLGIVDAFIPYVRGVYTGSLSGILLTSWYVPVLLLLAISIRFLVAYRAQRPLR